jgi:hypothetical protein
MKRKKDSFNTHQFFTQVELIFGKVRDKDMKS